MDNNILNTIAFPGDTYRSLLLDIGKFKSHDLDNVQIMRQKAIAFIISFINGVNKLNSNSNNEVNKTIFGENFNLIRPKYLAELAFNKDTIDIILELLKEFDNSYFWEAFGVSEEKGAAFYEELQHPDKSQDVLCEIHKEIVDSNKIKKEIVINEILQYCLFGVDIPDDFCDELAGISFCFNEILQKYPSIREALSILYNDGTNFNVISFLKGIELFNGANENISSKSLFELMKFTYPFGDLNLHASTFHEYLNSDNSIGKIFLLNSFKIHRYGYEAYLVYLSWCEENKCEPALKVGNNPELYFYNSYKVPQIESLYKRYFSELSEEEAKEITKECFEEIYNSLRNKGFLDEECRKEEFFWAFSLTDEYPFAFKKIKFYTLTGKSKKDKGNGAFLCLLTILGYTSEEIKAMLHRNPEKSIINKTFDLTIKNNTIMSKDYDTLLKIVKSSGLPI